MKGTIEGKRAREYDLMIKNKSKTKIFNEFILDHIKLSKDLKMCDLCCGSGVTIDLFKDKVNEIVGVDASREMINICEEKYSKDQNIKLIFSSATKVLLPPNHFDYVVVRMGLHHIEDKEKVLDEVLRILKPKGKLILLDKYHKNIFSYYLTEYFDIIFKRNKKHSFFDHFIRSRRYTRKILLSRFDLIKEKLGEIKKSRTTQAFYMVLQKK